MSPETSPATRAAVLIEALPYIRRFRDKVVVVKYGGAALEAAVAADETQADGPGAAAGSDGGGEASLASFANDIVLMRSIGIHPVVIHGGGPQIGAMMRRLGKEPEFRDGLRVTDAETLEIARMVLVGKVNREIVGALNVHGPLAVGLSGEDAGLITAGPMDPTLGFVGEVVAADPSILRRLVAEGLVPVVATLGADREGQSYNINADTVAGAVAEALGAEKLVFLTDVDGIRSAAHDPQSRLAAVSADELDRLVDSGAVGAGMIPKVQAAARSVRHGVGSAHVLDGRVKHVLLLEILTREGVGTMVTA
jgi:acetylglutamate kinase